MGPEVEPAPARLLDPCDGRTGPVRPNWPGHRFVSVIVPIAPGRRRLADPAGPRRAPLRAGRGGHRRLMRLRRWPAVLARRLSVWSRPSFRGPGRAHDRRPGPNRRGLGLGYLLPAG